MPFNSSGVFQRLFNWRTDRDNNVTIRADRMDQEFDGIAAALNDITGGNVGFRAPLRGVSGTQAAPAYSFQNDPNTGLRRADPDDIAVVAGGVDQLRLKAGVASGAAVQSNHMDNTPGKVLTVGAFGENGGDAVPALSDMDHATISGTHVVSIATTANKPGSPDAAGIVEVRRWNAENVFQRYTVHFPPSRAGEVYLRAYQGGGWQDWSLQYNQANILGAVSGSLIENLGALVQYGNLPNGEFWRFAGGHQICKRRVDLGSRSSTSGAGGLHRSDTFSFGLPSGFASGSFVGASISGDLFPNGLMYAVSCNTSQWSVRIGAVAPFAAVDCGDVVLTAFGPWASQ